MAPAKPKANSKPARGSTSKKKYASKFLQAWIGDLHWMSRSDRALSHAFAEYATRILALLQEDSKGYNADHHVWIPQSRRNRMPKAR